MDSLELKTLEKCTLQLEKALLGLDRELVHFLKEECFILGNVRDEVLEARSMVPNAQKAGELVKWIKNRVQQDPESYYVLVDRLKKDDKLYKPILNTLDEEHRGITKNGEQKHHRAILYYFLQ